MTSYHGPLFSLLSYVSCPRPLNCDRPWDRIYGLYYLYINYIIQYLLLSYETTLILRLVSGLAYLGGPGIYAENGPRYRCIYSVGQMWKPGKAKLFWYIYIYKWCNNTISITFIWENINHAMLLFHFCRAAWSRAWWWGWTVLHVYYSDGRMAKLTRVAYIYTI